MKLLTSLLNRLPVKNTLVPVIFSALSLIVAGVTVAEAQTPAVYRGIRVDMSGIPSGAHQTRDDIQVCLSLGLPRAFAGRINASAQGAPLLVVRPTSIWLAPMGSSPSSDEFGSSDSNTGFDSMEGEAIIGNRRVPLTVSAGAPSHASVMSVDAARMRSIGLCNSFIGWLARKI
jgi:hypothetical protein